MENNPIIELAEFCQRQFGENIETKVLEKTGPDHMPVVKVKIDLPNGREYVADGGNKKIAKRKAAEEALKDIRNGNV